MLATRAWVATATLLGLSLLLEKHGLKKCPCSARFWRWLHCMQLNLCWDRRFRICYLPHRRAIANCIVLVIERAAVRRHYQKEAATAAELTWRSRLLGDAKKTVYDERWEAAHRGALSRGRDMQNRGRDMQFQLAKCLYFGDTPGLK
jgi:hypothetical protein